MLSGRNQTQKDKYCIIPLIRKSRTGKFIVAESRLEVMGAWEYKEIGRYCLMGTEFLFGIMRSSGNG